METDADGRVVYPRLGDVRPRPLPTGIASVMVVNLVATIVIVGGLDDVQEVLRECDRLLALYKGEHMVNISGPKKLAVFKTHRAIAPAGECIGSSLKSMADFIVLLNRILSERRGLPETRTFVTAHDYQITNIVLHGHCVPFDCAGQIYGMHGHVYAENPDTYVGRSASMYRRGADGQDEYLGTVTPYLSCNVVLTGVRNLKDALHAILQQFSDHVGTFDFDKPLGPLPEARAEDTGSKLEVFLRPEDLAAPAPMAMN